MKPFQLKTKRLILSPLSEEETVSLIERTEDPALKTAYGEMLAGMKKDPEAALFYAPIAMIRRKDGVTVGDLSFKGPPVRGAVEIGYGVEDAFRGQGYATEAAAALIDRVFWEKDVYTVEAEAEEDNAASLRVLQKIGFLPTGKRGEEGPRFVKEKGNSCYFAVYMMFGLAIGFAISNMTGHFLWASLGAFPGLAVGLVLDDFEKKHRAEVTGKTEDDPSAEDKTN